MTYSLLRKKHPRFVYETALVFQRENSLHVRFSFLLEPNTHFYPELVIPTEGPAEKTKAQFLAFHLGLVEAISYWKAACPGEFVVKAGFLDKEQIAWWKDLFINGLGEFFYKNNIDFTQKDFLRISCLSSLNSKLSSLSFSPRDLVLVGGGKDSAVTLKLLKKNGRPTRALVLNPTRAALDNIKIAGFTNPIIVKRKIDPKLFELNSTGYLNGHTPFSAYLAFLGLFVAVLRGYENIIVSNESSANEGNLIFRGLEVNHQYSKSFSFEKKFRAYVSKYLTQKHQYFSLLRPLNELQIAKFFSTLPQYFFSFRSCNTGSKTDSWCGKCAKCAFVYLTLAPFIPREQLLAIFGTKPETRKFIQEMREGRKPFECVGTKEEVEQALAGKPDLSFWNPQHFVPEKYLKLLPYGRNSR